MALKTETAGDLYASAFGPAETYRFDIVLDKNGFKNSSLDKAFKLIFVGDSYVAIGSTDKTTISGYFERRTGQSVLNLGRGWYGPAQYPEVLKRYGLAHQPDRVLFFFFEGNDLRDCRQYLNWKRGGTYYDFPRRQPYWVRYYETVKWSAVSLAEGLASILHLWHSDAARPHPTNVVLSGVEFEAAFLYFASTMSPKEIMNSEGGQLIKTAFEEIDTLAQVHDFQADVVFVPTKAHIYARYVKDGSCSKGGCWQEQLLNESNLEEAIGEMARGAGLGFISLTPVFQREAAKGRLLYYPFDTHWNDEGRSVAADYLASLIMREATSVKSSPAEHRAAVSAKEPADQINEGVLWGR